MKTMLRTLAIALALAVVTGTQTAQADLWYSTQSEWTADSHLYSYDVATGTSTDRGVTQGLSLLTDIAFGGDGRLFGVGFANMYGGGSSKLYSLDYGDDLGPATFTELTIAGGISGTVNALAWRDGNLYAADTDKRFYMLTEMDDGSWSVAAQGKMSHASSGDLAFSDDGVLYATVQNGNSTRLATIDADPTSKKFGKDDFVGVKSDYDYVFGLAFVEGTLYGTGSSGNFVDSTLVEFDLNKGRTTAIASLGQPVWGMSAGGGATFGAATVPEPATLALMAAGLVGMTIRRRFR